MAQVCPLIVAAVLISSTGFGGERRPNVVLIISDDQTHTDFGFAGHPHVRTPHLDRLAARSARYTHGYVPSSVCRPSLVTLLTGLYPHQHGVHFNHPPPGFAKLVRSPDIDKPRFDALRERAAGLVREVPTLPRVLAANGYRCLQTGKYWEGHWRNAGFTEGMTTAEPSKPADALGNKRLANGDLVAHGNGDHGLVIGRETMEPIREFVADCRDRGDPFLVWYAPFLPHLPHDAPARHREPYERDVTVPRHSIPYLAACTWFDETVGELLRIVDRAGATNDTLVVFVVDNGFVPDPDRRRPAGDFDYSKSSKRSPFDDGLRTPILLLQPGRTRAGVHTTPCSSVDLVPTILEAIGLPKGIRDLPGRSLWPSAAVGRPLEPRPVVGAIYPGDASSLGHPERDVAYRWIRDGRFKLIVPHSHAGRPPWGGYVKSPALFDVLADPRELNDLARAPGHRRTIDRLRDRLDAWWKP